MSQIKFLGQVMLAFIIFSGTHAMAADSRVNDWIEQSDILKSYIEDKNSPKIQVFIKQGKNTFSDVFEEREVMIGHMRNRLADEGIDSILFDIALIERFKAGYYEPAKAIGEAMSICKAISTRANRNR